jgi:hypothetical protein
MWRLLASSEALQKDFDCGPGYCTSLVQLDVWKMIESEPLKKPLSGRGIS